MKKYIFKPVISDNFKSVLTIKKALINLLSKKDLSRITVSEITELADIGRGTFYTHYQDIYDLYHSLINELAKDLLNIFSKADCKI